MSRKMKRAPTGRSGTAAGLRPPPDCLWRVVLIRRVPALRDRTALYWKTQGGCDWDEGGGGHPFFSWTGVTAATAANLARGRRPCSARTRS